MSEIRTRSIDFYDGMLLLTFWYVLSNNGSLSVWDFVKLILVLTLAQLVMRIGLMLIGLLAGALH